jgi:protein involved in polysaccharide export with SLBB domain
MPDCLFRSLSLVAALCAAEVTAAAQAIPRAVPVPGRPGMYAQPGYPAGERMEAVDPDKKLSPGDQVTYEIVEDKDGGIPRVVSATGELDVPPLGRVKVAGKTTREAEYDLKRRLEVDYYYKATVNLSIDRVSPTIVTSGTVYLAGEVRAVGPVEMISGTPLKLSEAILKAGGFGPWAEERKVQVTRRGGGAPQVIDVKEILQKGRIEKDINLQDGDRVYVPQSFFKK